MRFFSLITGIFLSVLTQQSWAQAANADWCNPAQRPATITTGGFTIQGQKYGCSPLTVNLTPTVGANHQYLYDYRGGDPLSTAYQSLYKNSVQNSYITATPRVYKIMQLGSSGTGSIFCDEVTVLVKPNFQAKTCSGLKAQVTIANDSISQLYEAFIINWDDGTAPTRIAKSASMIVDHQYTNTTLRKVSVVGVYQNQPVACLNNTTDITPVGTNINGVAIQRVTTGSNGLVAVQVRGTVGVAADLQMSTGSNGVFANTSFSINKNDTTTFTIQNIDANKNTYCFKLSTNDGCQSTGGSSTVCTVSLEAIAQNRQNALQWGQYPTTAGFTNYRIVRNAVPLTSIPNVTTTQYNDKAVTCGESYSYQLVAVLDNGAESRSAFKTVVAISDETPSVVRNPFVTVNADGQSISITALPPASGTSQKYTSYLQRAMNGSADFQEVSTKNSSLSYTESDVNTAEQSYCYRVVYQNACGNRSEPSPAVCSIRLYSKTGSTFDWTPQSPFSTPVTQYIIDKLDENGTLVDQITLGNATTFQPNLDDPNSQTFRYRIIARSVTGVGISYSNVFVLRRPAQLYVPTAFSPNGDAQNDIFLPKGLFLDKFEMTVFNRWGAAIFQSTRPNAGWDGTINGQPAPEGFYVYKIDVIDSLGERYIKSGTFMLAR